MNNIDINLVKVEKASPKSKKAAKLRLFAFALIITVGFIAVVFFILDFYSPINEIKKQQDAILASISSENEKAVKLAIVNERALSINKLKLDRPDYVGVLNTAVENLSSEVSATGLNIDESSVGITVASSSLLTLNNFLNSVVDESKKNENIKSVSMESLTANDASSSYLMTIKFNLK